ncbi:HAD family hydrolase [Staphylococcus sp. NRL 18/288]|nr:HAD family hydrolase [Staphylococcus sp. NRL 18/288]MCJ1662811.1 HAD family hydrolase [Staphylococcus sp. NRL 18/288]
MKYENYIFDFDGTLGDSKECSIVAKQQAFKTFGLNIPTEQDITYYMGIPIEVSFLKMSQRTLSEQEVEQLLTLFRQKYKVYETDYLKPFEYISEVIRLLSEANKKLFVVSSKKTEVLIRNLESIGLYQYITEAIGSDKVKAYKPNPDGILSILNKYNLRPDKAVYIGDAIFDIQMAKAARIDSIAVTWGSHSKEALSNEQPNYVIEEPIELTRI